MLTAMPGPSGRGIEMMGQRTVGRGFSVLDTSNSGVATTGCRCLNQSTSKNVRAFAERAWYRGGRKLSNGKYA